MKPLTGILLVMFIFLVSPLSASAHPGNTASDGCHYCRTNCSSWGEVYGARHCHGGGSTYNPPVYTPPVYTPPVYTPPVYTPPPSCPLMSSYNSSTSKCECYSGYVSNGSSCISEDQSCKNQYGYNATSNYDGECKCRYGYTWNSSRTSCISEDQSCKNQHGYNSTSDYSGGCKCRYGYTLQSGSCQLEEVKTYPIVPYVPKIYSVTPTNTPMPTFTPKPTKRPNLIITPTPTSELTPSPTSVPINLDNFTESTPAPKKIFGNG